MFLGVLGRKLGKLSFVILFKDKCGSEREDKVKSFRSLKLYRVKIKGWGFIFEILSYLW